MGKPEFVSLHNHFDKGSLLDGYGRVPEYLERVKELGQRGCGITDHGMVSATFEFVKAFRSEGLIGIPGSELYVAPINSEGARVKSPVYYGETTYDSRRKTIVPVSKNDVSSSGAYLHLTAWAYNDAGMKNLFRLSSQSWQQENYYKKNRVDFDMLAEFSDGLIVSTGCPSSEISTRFLLGQDDKAYEYASRLKDVFGSERLFVEVMNHNMKIDLERNLLPKQVELSKKLGLNLLATNDCHYAHRGDAPFHEEMLCVQSGSVMSDPTYDEGGSRFAFDGAEYYLKTADEMAALFPEDQFPNALKSSLVIAEMAQDANVVYDPTLMVRPPLDEGFTSQVSFFKHLIREGFESRYHNHPEEYRERVQQQLNKEFEVIYSSDFIGYFLAVRNFIIWTKDKFAIRDELERIIASPIGAGRGSVGGSATAFVLGISEVDPLRFDLVFERFLTTGRGDTYRITYDDGSFEDVLISEKKVVVGEDKSKKRYIHQLKVGDLIEDVPAVEQTSSS